MKSKARVIRVSSRESVRKAVRVLKSGGLIVFPTETSYGLGADALNKKAVAAAFRVKNSPESKRISVMVADKAMAKRFFKVTKDVEDLIDAFLPGPLTIITKGKSFRIPDNSFCLKLVKSLGRPVTCTSANTAGAGDCYSIEDVKDSLDNVDLFIDGGCLPKRRPSTVFDVDSGIIVREGPISMEQIRKVFHPHFSCLRIVRSSNRKNLGTNL